MENTVDMNLGSVLDDAAQAQGGTLETLSDLTEQQQANPDTPPKTEPGWIKQRVNAAVNKAVAEAEARVAARYEAMLAPMRESMLDREAQELVQSGEFKSLDRAKEYVRLKNGAQPTAPSAEVQPPARDAQGRFAKTETTQQGGENPVTKAKADLLAAQAKKIINARGIDVMQAFNDNPEIQQKVLSGEWDFYDVADHMTSGGKMVPSPMRTPNGSGNRNAVSIRGMTAEQFRKLDENLASGSRYDLR